ncbi:MAG: molybdopterin molybdotransferase MoeA [Desulfobacteraceae bacterium]|nr:molybdopterin molybdotransferase MoeA [Desulfobacteraceae bacterium]
MSSFLQVTDLQDVYGRIGEFGAVSTERLPIESCLGRITAEAVVSPEDLPPFSRATMDGFAVRAMSTFGASEANPAYLTVVGDVAMGETAPMQVGPGQAVRIATGGMIPEGADSVVMVEHTETVDNTMVEVFSSVAPGQNVIEKGEDVAKSGLFLPPGKRLRPQELGILAALGQRKVTVYRRPVVAVISTGDEIVPIETKPATGQIRDVNTYTLCGLIRNLGAEPLPLGIVGDEPRALRERLLEGLRQSDTVMISGGSSVGTRDYTVQVLSDLPDSAILVQGISIRPGKPTILARCGTKAVWGLPGQVTSAMVVFDRVIAPFVEALAGMRHGTGAVLKIPARLTRNVPSAQGRIDYVRVRLRMEEGELTAEPVLGKSGLLRTMIIADGLVEIGVNDEGLDENSSVLVIPLTWPIRPETGWSGDMP